MEVIVFDNLMKLFDKAADTFVHLSEQSIRKNNRFVIALSGGSSPKGLFDLLASQKYSGQIEWASVYVFWVDERWVPLDDDRSNARMTFEMLLDKVPVNRHQVFPMYREAILPEDYAGIYEQQIKNVLGNDGIFDFILLGMGDDGHTASLFPFQKVLGENKNWVSAYYLESQNIFRITLTAPLINRAANILVITFGESKRPALNEVLNGKYDPALYPLQLIAKRKGLMFFTTEKTDNHAD